MCRRRCGEHRTPVKPRGQAQWKAVSDRSTQVPPLAHGPAMHGEGEGEGGGCPAVWSQVNPEKPGGQAQAKPGPWSVQLPSLRQGLGAQLSSLISQKAPVKPAGHRQDAEAIPPALSTHVPLFWQGELKDKAVYIHMHTNMCTNIFIHHVLEVMVAGPHQLEHTS